MGGWRLRENGEVVLQLLEDVGAEGRMALEGEAARLSAWLGGTKLLPRFPSPLSKAHGLTRCSPLSECQPVPALGALAGTAGAVAYCPRTGPRDGG